MQRRGEQSRGAEVAEGGGGPREQQRHEVERCQDEDERLGDAAAVVDELAAQGDGRRRAAEEQRAWLGVGVGLGLRLELGLGLGLGLARRASRGATPRAAARAPRGRVRVA